MSNPVATALHGSAQDASNIIYENQDHQLLGAALVNALNRIHALEKRLEAIEQEHRSN